MTKKLLSILFVLILHQSNGQSFDWGNKQIKNGDTIRTYQVIFDLGKWDITDYSKPFLDSLVTFLKMNNTVEIEVANHGDIRTSQELSFFVTQARAESIKEYLVYSGVESERIVANGYEGDYPLFTSQDINELKTTEQKEEAHTKNRRTEIILKTKPNNR